MRCLFVNPQIGDFFEGLTPGQVPLLKRVVAGSRTLRERLEFSRKALSSLGLLTAATVGSGVRPDVHFDFIDENLDARAVEDELEQGVDLLALGGTVYQMNRILALIREAAKRKIPVVVGGAAAMTFPDLFTRKGVSVVLGESEPLFPEFLTDWEKGAPKGRYESHSNAGMDLKHSPVPDFSLAETYDHTFVGIQTSRGCPYHCEFCQVSGMLGDTYRRKPLERIVEETRRVKSLWPDAFFFFYDNNFFADREFARGVLLSLSREGVKLGRWGTNADASVYEDGELLDLAMSLGPLDYLGIGFESLSGDSLSTIKNRKKAGLLKKYDEVVEALKAKGVGVFGYFMFGFESGTADDLEAAVRFILHHDIDAQISRLVPMPGTRLYDRLLAEVRERSGAVSRGPLGRWNQVRELLLEKSGFTLLGLTELLAGAYERIYDDSRRASALPLPAPFL